MTRHYGNQLILEKRIRDELTTFLDRKLRIYVVATGAGAGIQQAIWSVPGCSAFFAGASFPYTSGESTAFAGLQPEQFASEDFSLDLAAAAYMRALDLNDPSIESIGLAVTASVTSLKPHRGDHRIHVACMTRDRVIGQTVPLQKIEPPCYESRNSDGLRADWEGLMTLIAAATPGHDWNYGSHDWNEKARKRFFMNPVFQGGHRLSEAPSGPLFPGAFDPPHAGHEGIARSVAEIPDGVPLFAICATMPHKAALSVQEMLRRAKLLVEMGHRVLFTEGDAFYIDKARKFPGRNIIIGADALIRMFDPKWGQDVEAMIREFETIPTAFYIFGREIDGRWLSAQEAIASLPVQSRNFLPLDGRWDLSSTEFRNHPHHQVPASEAGPTCSVASAPTTTA